MFGVAFAFVFARGTAASESGGLRFGNPSMGVKFEGVVVFEEFGSEGGAVEGVGSELFERSEAFACVVLEGCDSV